MTSVDQGRLLVLMGRTYDSHRILMALAVVDSETRANVEWFLRQVKAAFTLEDGKGVMVFSDYGPAVRGGISDVLPLATNPCCTIHFEVRCPAACFLAVLARYSRMPNPWQWNIVDKFRLRASSPTEKNGLADSIKLVRQAAHAPNKALCAKALGALQAKDEPVYNYVSGRSLDLWCVSHMLLNPLSNLTSNDAEGFFGRLAEEKRTLALHRLLPFVMLTEAERCVACCLPGTDCTCTLTCSAACSSTSSE